MVSPGIFVKRLADVLGVPDVFVFQHDRNLSEAGLRTKTGRGKSAANVTPRDAAHLLTAVLGSAQITQSVETVRIFSETRSAFDSFFSTRIDGLTRLSTKHSFIDGLEAVICATMDRTIDRAFGGSLKRIEVLAATRVIGDITLASRQQSVTVRYVIPDPYSIHQTMHPPVEEVEAWLRKTNVSGDLEQYRRVSEKTVRSIAAALATDA